MSLSQNRAHRGMFMKDNDKLTSRSAMLRTLAAAPIVIGALAQMQEADAAATMSQSAAAYVDHPNKGQQCDGCSLFIPAKSNPMKANGACQLVKGAISPKGWCKFYSAKPK